MSIVKVGTLQNLSGTEVYTCKAWVNFNGTGTVAIRASGNVSSITDNGTGLYRLNFTTAMPDVNYAWTSGAYSEAATDRAQVVLHVDTTNGGKTTNAVSLTCVAGFDGTTFLSDQSEINIAIFR